MDTYQHWQQTPLGHYLVQEESNKIKEMLANTFGYYFFHLGLLDETLLQPLTKFERKLCLLEKSATPKGFSAVEADPAMLPFRSESIDAALLTHALDFASEPQAVLREVHRVLIGEGVLVLSGFHIGSLLSLQAKWLKITHKKDFLAQAKFFQVSRIVDWLTLLGFAEIEVKYTAFRLPMESLLPKTAFLDRLNDLQCPVGASIYLIKAKKRQFSFHWLPANNRLERAYVKPYVTGFCS